MINLVVSACLARGRNRWCGCVVAPLIFGMTAVPALAQEDSATDSSTRFFDAEVEDVCRIVEVEDGTMEPNTWFSRLSSRAEDGGESALLKVLANRPSSMAFTVEDDLLEFIPEGTGIYHGDPGLRVFVQGNPIGKNGSFRPVSIGVSYPEVADYSVDVVLTSEEGTMFHAGEYRVIVNVSCVVALGAVNFVDPGS